MSRDVYRISSASTSTPAPRVRPSGEAFAIPILALLGGVLFLAIDLCQGAANATEGGLGVASFAFGIWGLAQELRSGRR